MSFKSYWKSSAHQDNSLKWKVNFMSHLSKKLKVVISVSSEIIIQNHIILQNMFAHINTYIPTNTFTVPKALIFISTPTKKIIKIKTIITPKNQPYKFSKTKLMVSNCLHWILMMVKDYKLSLYSKRQWENLKSLII